ncbi:hypothetical protein EIN_197820 [Entamoeba invadens IP1]|uniref:Leucine rich repeat containing protein BspA family protein n=1 Tax=Entamoeba invadens IP1 TaxID=370355 RepID=A0A0A1TUT6_ENTIV|nr:hypothetical protein EIN_197820 [Entamoeba invadens IP1]ELP83839.1 hypothetical protein EIN_197820 [Entamoeba invadens IP1]|eukprot:XP_004183185.1 hypothetical protein EIN_197820 [Entamoeba invadens IP1]
MATLDCYSLMIVSKYFQLFSDYENVECVCKKFAHNMERFHYNPIPMNKKTRKFFPKVETQHLYSKNDIWFNDGLIFKHVIWYEVFYHNTFPQKEHGNVCKRILYTEMDRLMNGNSTIPNDVCSLGNRCYQFANVKELVIPQNVTSLLNACFYGCVQLTKLQLPTTLNSVDVNALIQCTNLINLIIPNYLATINNNVLFGNERLLGLNVFSEQFNVNGKKIQTTKQVTSFTVPNCFTGIGTSCFANCESLQTIVIPQNVLYIGKKCFAHCDALRTIIIGKGMNQLISESIDESSHITFQSL